MSQPGRSEGDKSIPDRVLHPGSWRKQIPDEELPTEEELQKLIYGEPPKVASKGGDTDQEDCSNLGSDLASFITLPTPVPPRLRRSGTYGGHHWFSTAGVNGDSSETHPSEQNMEARESKSINDVRPEEVETYLAVPAWRIWERTIFSKGAYLEAAKEAGSKNLALITNQNDKGYSYIYYKLEDAEMARNPNRPRLPFGYESSICTTYLPRYILEPLTEDEVKIIDEMGEVPGPAGSIDRQAEILRPDELQKIFTDPNTRFRPIKFPPATI